MDSINYLNSYDEVARLVQEVQKRRMFNQSIMEHYRGQGKPEYKLVPKVTRELNNSKDVQDNERFFTKKFLEDLKTHNCEKILRIDNAFNDEQNLWNILFQAQHLNVPTRFLDWSLKWEVGLWFAVANPKYYDVNGQFWIFSVPNSILSTDSKDNYYKKDLKSLDKTYFINAPIFWSDELINQVGEVRRERQFGMFSISPYEKAFVPLEEQEDIIPHLEKYCIPAKMKGQIRLELTARCIHKEWLYYREDICEKLNENKEKFL